MKKFLTLIMSFVMLSLSLVACGGNDTVMPNATTVTDPPVTTTVPDVTTAEPEPEPEPFYTNEIIKDGKSEYVIVHDGTEAMMLFATKVRSMVTSSFGITL